MSILSQYRAPSYVLCHTSRYVLRTYFLLPFLVLPPLSVSIYLLSFTRTSVHPNARLHDLFVGQSAYVQTSAEHPFHTLTSPQTVLEVSLPHHRSTPNHASNPRPIPPPSQARHPPSMRLTRVPNRKPDVPHPCASHPCLHTSVCPADAYTSMSSCPFARPPLCIYFSDQAMYCATLEDTSSPQPSEDIFRASALGASSFSLYLFISDHLPEQVSILTHVSMTCSWVNLHMYKHLICRTSFPHPTPPNEPADCLLRSPFPPTTPNRPRPIPTESPRPACVHTCKPPGDAATRGVDTQHGLRVFRATLLCRSQPFRPPPPHPLRKSNSRPACRLEYPRNFCGSFKQ